MWFETELKRLVLALQKELAKVLMEHRPESCQQIRNVTWKLIPARTTGHCLSGLEYTQWLDLDLLIDNFLKKTNCNLKKKANQICDRFHSPWVVHGRLPFVTSDREHNLGTSSRQIDSIRLAFLWFSDVEPGTGFSYLKKYLKKPSFTITPTGARPSSIPNLQLRHTFCWWFKSGRIDGWMIFYERYPNGFMTSSLEVVKTDRFWWQCMLRRFQFACLTLESADSEFTFSRISDIGLWIRVDIKDLFRKIFYFRYQLCSEIF